MQQQFDLLLFLISNAVFVYWCVLAFSHKGEKTLLLSLSKRQAVILVVVEVVLFIGMYLNYETHKSVDVADSFAWHYSIIYARGVLPIAGLASINDKIFDFKDPVFSCLAVGLIVDYLILLLCSKIASIVKK
jgi:hypothetical protein